MTKRAGVIGHPIGHSISPIIYKAAFDAAGMDASYEAWDTAPDLLEGRINSLRAADYYGANVTIPHKQAVIPMLDATSEVADRAGAVNTIVHDEGSLVGHNTDVTGFARALAEAGFEPKGARTLVLGSGGAARAVALALVEGGAEVVFMVGRHPRRTEQVVLALKPLTPPGTTITWAYWGDGSYLRTLREADLVVNCTPIGMAGSDMPGESPVEQHLIEPHTLVFDLVYNPMDTPLLDAAKERGAKVVPGVRMLVYQAAESFRLWTRHSADTDQMFAAAELALGPKG